MERRSSAAPISLSYGTVTKQHDTGRRQLWFVKGIQRTFGGIGHIPEHMGVDHRRLQILMTQQALHLPDVHPALEQVRGKASFLPQQSL